MRAGADTTTRMPDDERRGAMTALAPDPGESVARLVLVERRPGASGPGTPRATTLVWAHRRRLAFGRHSRADSGGEQDDAGRHQEASGQRTHTLSSKASLLARYDEEKPRVQQTASARGEQLKAQAQDTASRLGD